MNKRYAAVFASAVIGGAVALTTLGPAARATTFDPCAATAHGALRYPAGTSTHLVFALSSGYSSNHVIVTECVKNGGTWTKVAATSGRAGENGFAEPGGKREGDGKSPTGSYTLTEAFGMGDPGTTMPYRRLRPAGDCWGATPGASSYNEYYSGTCRSTDEDLSATMLRGPYHQVVVIDYNRPRPVPGNGSAIFFHVGGATPTAGCIAIPEPALRSVMRTLVKGDRMVMGPRSAIFRS